MSVPLVPVRRSVALQHASWRRLAGADWHQPFRDVHVSDGLDPEEPVTRARAAALLLPDGAALGGWAAAALLGCVDADGRRALPEGGWRLDPVLLCLSRPQQVQRRAGIVPFRSDLGSGDVVEVAGLPVTSPVRTCFDLGRLAPSAEEAVVALDGAVRDLRVDLEELAGYAAERRRWRGVPLLRRALRHVDPHSGSPGESRLRWVWVVEAGLPVPVLNREVRTLDGTLLGVPDLLGVELGLAGEYDGDPHLGLERATSDNVRSEQLEGVGLTLVRATALDVGPHRRRLVRRLRERACRAHERRAAAARWVLGPYRPPRRRY